MKTYYLPVYFRPDGKHIALRECPKPTPYEAGEHIKDWFIKAVSIPGVDMQHVGALEVTETMDGKSYESLVSKRAISIRCAR